MAGWGRSTWGTGPWGQPAIQSISFAITGTAGTSAVGTIVASIPTSVTETGFSVTGTLAGITSVTGTCNITEAGVAGTSALGTIAASIPVTIAETGVSATSALGSIVSVTGIANIAKTGVVGTGAVSSIVASNPITFASTGVTSTGAVGSTTAAGVAISGVSGVASSTFLGDEQVVIPITQAITGVAGTSGL